MSEVKQVVTIVDKSTKGLGAQIAALLKVTNELASVGDRIPAMADEISMNQARLDAIAEETSIAQRKAAAELSLRVTENEDKVLSELMAKRSLATITKGELAILNTKLGTAEAFNQDEIVKAVDAAKASLTVEHKAELAQVNSTHAVKSATTEAALEAANAKIGFLEAQVKSLQDTITAEREARIQEAEARSKAAGVTVNNGK